LSNPEHRERRRQRKTDSTEMEGRRGASSYLGSFFGTLSRKGKNRERKDKERGRGPLVELVDGKPTSDSFY